MCLFHFVHFQSATLQTQDLASSPSQNRVVLHAAGSLLWDYSQPKASRVRCRVNSFTRSTASPHLLTQVWSGMPLPEAPSPAQEAERGLCLLPQLSRYVLAAVRAAHEALLSSLPSWRESSQTAKQHWCVQCRLLGAGPRLAGCRKAQRFPRPEELHRLPGAVGSAGEPPRASRQWHGNICLQKQPQSTDPTATLWTAQTRSCSLHLPRMLTPRAGRSSAEFCKLANKQGKQ